MAPPSSLRSVRSAGSTRTRAKSDAMPPSSFYEPPVSTPLYSHVSSYRSLQMELLLYSPSVKVVPTAWSANHTLPVFGDHDVVGGKIILDPSCQTGRLMLAIQGAFVYNTEKTVDTTGPYARPPEKRKHVFFSSSKVIHVTAADANPPRSALREVFVIKRRPSGSNIKSMVLEPRAYPFAFELPRSHRSGEELPPTFCSADPKRALFEVVYQVSATWESSDITENPSFLEVPIVLHPDADFHSLDGLSDSSTSWLEMPLKSERPISDFRCAVTLPASVTFSRSSSIPYFVVFTTTPRSSALAREIASDATISISVFSQVTITEAATFPITPPQTPSDESSSDSLPFRQPGQLLKRVRSRTSPWSPRTPSDESDLREKPLPRLPMQTVLSETQTMHTGICIGFPKRPRHQQKSAKDHPSLDAHNALPDGLHKAKIPLDRNMLPSIDWAGLSVKYYMDISVLFGSDELRARVPLRIT
ncbi:hypothetical protein FB45DRAFT_476879 [Roridomyces roridus]|uniref:Uncharacterized protein n=1 Tax=Roridomyces roridus TaxID=1738132 RepID=A0AAD7BZH0_9AGAR|nr:hypothetical protein FB45DRAFT_476879 [Roridomyces roridus]